MQTPVYVLAWGQIGRQLAWRKLPYSSVVAGEFLDRLKLALIVAFHARQVLCQHLILVVCAAGRLLRNSLPISTVPSSTMAMRKFDAHATRLLLTSTSPELDMSQGQYGGEFCRRCLQLTVHYSFGHER